VSRPSDCLPAGGLMARCPDVRGQHTGACGAVHRHAVWRQRLKTAGELGVGSVKIKTPVLSWGGAVSRTLNVNPWRGSRSARREQRKCLLHRENRERRSPDRPCHGRHFQCNYLTSGRGPRRPSMTRIWCAGLVPVIGRAGRPVGADRREGSDPRGGDEGGHGLGKPRREADLDRRRDGRRRGLHRRSGRDPLWWDAAAVRRRIRPSSSRAVTAGVHPTATPGSWPRWPGRTRSTWSGAAAFKPATGPPALT